MEKRRREPGPWSVRAPDGADTEGAVTCKASLFRASSPVEERRAAGRGADEPAAGVTATAASLLPDASRTVRRSLCGVFCFEVRFGANFLSGVAHE